MNTLFDNPAVQSAIVPFIVTMLFALSLKRFGWKWAELGLVLGFFSCVYLSIGLDIFPLTSTRKIIVLGFAAFVVAAILDYSQVSHRKLTYILAVAGGCASVWIVWPYAMRMEGIKPWIIILSSLVFVAITIFSFEKIKPQPEKSLAGLLVLATGLSISAVLGASASMGQLAGAIAASTGVYFLLHLIKLNVSVHRNLSLTASTLLGMIGISAVVYAKLPWYSLLLLGFIPVILQLPLPQRIGIIPPIILNTVYGVPLAAIAILITLQVAGAPPF